MPLRVTTKIEIPDEDLRFTFSRSSGPGGQNVNKVNTKALLTFDLENTAVLSEVVKQRIRKEHANRINSDGQLLISNQESREQARNRQSCFDKLLEIIGECLKQPKKRKPTRRTYASKRRRLDNKKKNSQKKKDRRWRNDT
ncbi:MAG: alternative ribosome rescue aminoacyl-tRNA hydrolase ArfB [Pirellulaceae bacterium]